MLIFSLFFFQIVVDYNLLITSAYTGWPGCTHDARVLRNSSLFDDAESGGIISPNKVIAADSTYPLRNCLISPFRDNGNLSAEQRRFNRVFSSCRVTVERAIGHLKGRFRRLKEITVHSLNMIALTIISGCILHNLCILSHEAIDQFIVEDAGDNHPNQYVNIFQNAADGVERGRQLMGQLP